MNPIRLADCCKAAQRAFGINALSFYSQRSDRQSAWARYAAAALAYEHTGASLPKIGRAINRDHTTVLHGIRRVRALRETDPEFADSLTAAQRELARLTAPAYDAWGRPIQ